ncbi:MAG: DUF411 domain-containing protein [Gammaproteobacteria bacterium]|jgi:hypothetical protein|uniref:DUF411 domain-containing protein n=1 Tax=Methylotuvimicrobium sp. TaxID=2822413 RepID=UPI001D22A8E3|nr:DUF411 domain-containing protein [Gammaproteobacteria bacterium]
MKKILTIMMMVSLVFAGRLALAEIGVAKDVVVYRSPSCGCCGKWVKHLKDNNFNVIDNVVHDVDSVKRKYGVPSELASCHTAIVGDYVIEGHVPVEDIEKLLSLKADVLGIAVPGMPVGTPGMEMGDRKDAYKVIAFDKEGRKQVFSAHAP